MRSRHQQLDLKFCLDNLYFFLFFKKINSFKLDSCLLHEFDFLVNECLIPVCLVSMGTCLHIRSLKTCRFFHVSAPRSNTAAWPAWHRWSCRPCGRLRTFCLSSTSMTTPKDGRFNLLNNVLLAIAPLLHHQCLPGMVACKPPTSPLRSVFLHDGLQCCCDDERDSPLGRIVLAALHLLGPCRSGR